MGKIKTSEVLKELKLMKKRSKVEEMLLFGSRARNEELLTSDVDVIVISKRFVNMPFRQRPNKFLDAWTLPVDLEIICYSPEEFSRKKKEIGLVREAVKQGVFI